MTRSTKLLCALLCATLSTASLASEAFEVTTPGIAGTDGLVPRLLGGGSGLPGQPAALLVRDTQPLADNLLVFSFLELAQPFAGGILGPAPDFLVSLPRSDAQGRTEARLRLPPDAAPGQSIWLQVFSPDVGAAAGLAATNSLQFTVSTPQPGVGLFAGASYAASSNPGEPVVADFDSDGLPDIATSSAAAGSLVILFGTGDGTFGAPVPYPTISPSPAVASADVNGDGHADLIVARTLFEDTAIFLGHGDGSFAPGIFVPIAQPFTIALAVADLDADGAPDFVTLGALASGATAYLGDGDGQFSPAWTLGLDNSQRGLALGDLTGDGLPDLAITSIDPNELSVYPGNGDGSFGAKLISAPSGPAPGRVALHDLDDDGDLDAVILSQSNVPPRVTVLRTLAGGGLGAPSPNPLSFSPRALGVADVNADEILDLLVATTATNDMPGRLEVLLGLGNGEFSDDAKAFTGNQPSGLAVADFDLDGRPDVAVAHTGGSSGVNTFLGAPDGGLRLPARYGVGKNPVAVALGDIDGDGSRDMAVLRGPGDGDAGGLTLRFGAIDGSFGPQTQLDSAHSPAALAIGDLDGNGTGDLVVSGFTSASSVSVFLAANDGSLTSPASFEVGGSVDVLVLRDVDADGTLDLLGITNGQTGAWIRAGLGDGSFGGAAVQAAGLTLSDLAVADVNADGLLDLALSTPSGAGQSAGVALALGTGGGNFAAPLLSASQGSGGRIVVADLNGDGAPDVALTSLPAGFPSGSVETLLGQGDGSFDAALSFSFESVLRALQAADLDGDGHVDLVFTEAGRDRVTILAGTGGGGFHAPSSYVAGGLPAALAIAPLDADGAPDLVFVNTDSNNAFVLLNQSAR